MGAPPRRQGLARSAAASLAVAIVAVLVPTPHDPGEAGRCGSLAGGGLLDDRFACEQTRGVFRGVVVVGVVLAVGFVVAHRAARRWRRIAALGVIVIGVGLALDLAVETVAGDPLTYRWVAVAPAALVAASVPGLWALWHGRRREATAP